MKAKCQLCTTPDGAPVEAEFDTKAERDRWVDDHASGHRFFTDDEIAGHGAVVKPAD